MHCDAFLVCTVGNLSKFTNFVTSNLLKDFVARYQD